MTWLEKNVEGDSVRTRYADTGNYDSTTQICKIQKMITFMGTIKRTKEYQKLECACDRSDNQV